MSANVFFESAVNIDIPAADVPHESDHRTVVHKGIKALLAFAESVFNALLFGILIDEESVAAYVAGVVTGGHGPQLHFNPRAGLHATTGLALIALLPPEPFHHFLERLPAAFQVSSRRLAQDFAVRVTQQIAMELVLLNDATQRIEDCDPFPGSRQDLLVNPWTLQIVARYAVLFATDCPE